MDYWISKHRFYELKHFVLQYGEWKKAYLAMDGCPLKSGNCPAATCSDILIEKHQKKKEEYARKIELVKKTCQETEYDAQIASYLLKAVTDGMNYQALTEIGLECDEEYFYDIYRKFFWLLDKKRG